MNRPVKATLAVAAVTAAAALVPFVANASSSSVPTPLGCERQIHAVSTAKAKVNNDIDALVRASSKPARTKAAKRHKAGAVSAARTRLRKDQRTLATTQQNLTSCEVGLQSVPTATATSTVTATATATATVTAPGTTATVAPTIPAYGGTTPTDGTTLFPMTNADDTEITPDGNWDGTKIVGSGYGSALAPDTADGAGWFYGLTDRGPNVGGPDGVKMDPVQGFQPAIGKFHLVNGHAELSQVIGLTTFAGDPMNGLVPPEVEAIQGTGDDIEDQYGATVPHSTAGIDSEGLVVDPDGGFFVSDEYGPYIVHLDASGRETYRYSPYVASDPYDGTAAHPEHIYPLPSELIRRNKNKGMEGLTVTPDGQYLVGIMQSPLQNNKATSGGAATTAAKGAIARIVKIKLSDHSVQEYLYALHFAQANNAIAVANSEITALDSDHFIVDERDGCFEGPATGQPAGSAACPAAAVKDLWKVDLANATDVGPSSPLLTAPPTIDGTAATVAYASDTSTTGALGTGNVGLTINGKSIEDIVGADVPTAAVQDLAADGVQTVDTGSRSTPGELFLNYSGLVNAIDPTGQYFGHDKVEGVAVDPSNPNVVYLSDDSDFGITDVPSDAGWPADSISHGGSKRVLGSDALKRLPGAGGQGTGVQDFGEIMKVDLTQVPSAYKG